MANAVALVKMIKKAAVEAMAAEKPVEICFGKVTGTEPLKILVEQKMTLGEAQLILTRNVTDFKTCITGEMEITVHNGLVVGDDVLLLRQHGGQKYIVWDRVG